MSRRALSDSNLRIKNLRLLVEELLKKTPDQNKVKSLMETSKLAYHADSCVQMETVLQALTELPNIRKLEIET